MTNQTQYLAVTKDGRQSIVSSRRHDLAWCEASDALGELPLGVEPISEGVCIDLLAESIRARGLKWSQGGDQ